VDACPTKPGLFPFFLLLLAGFASGQTSLPPRVGVIGETQLSLEQSIALALANNKDIELSKIDREVSAYALNGARGAFDPKFGVDSYLEDSTTPVGSVLSGSSTGKLQQHTFQSVPALSGSLPLTGATYSFTFQNQRLSTDNTFVSLSPEYPSNLTLTITQPLLRGLSIDDNRRKIQVARKNQSLTIEQFRQRVIDVVTQTEEAYWELKYAARNLEVQADAVDAARRQVESNQRQADQGVLAPIQVVEAQTQLATFQQNLFSAQASLTQAENALKVLILPDRSAPLWSSALVPVTSADLNAPVLPVADAVAEALANRPEVAAAKLNTDISRTNARYYGGQTKPQVDLIATYASNGLAGAVASTGANPLTGGFQAFIDRINQLSAAQGLPAVPPISLGGGPLPAALVGGYGQSLANLYGTGYPTAHVGIRVSLPIRNRAAEADLASSLADVRRQETQRAKLEQTIEADVRNAMQSVESGKSRLAASADARRSAEAQYSSEQRQFQAGTSTVFLVLQRQTTMISSRNAELRAQTDLARAIAEFNRATARTLHARNVDIEKH
jgi:HAE1 family hydrophobic/amphiphilic exporter-1